MGKKLGILLLGILLLGACATMSAERTFLLANQQFVEVIRNYNTLYDIQKEDVKLKWKADIDPVVIKANEILELWRVSLVLGDTTEAITKWNAIKPVLFSALISVGVVVED